MASTLIVAKEREARVNEFKARAAALAEQLGIEPPERLPSSMKDLEMFTHNYLMALTDFTLSALEALAKRGN